MNFSLVDREVLYELTSVYPSKPDRSYKMVVPLAARRDYYERRLIETLQPPLNQQLL